MSKQLNLFMSKNFVPDLSSNTKGKHSAIVNIIGARNEFISSSEMNRIDALELPPYEKVREIIKVLRSEKRYIHNYKFNVFLGLKFNEYVAMANIDKINSLDDLCQVLSDNRVESKKPAGSQLVRFIGGQKTPIEPIEADCKVDSFTFFANEIRVKTTKMFDTRFAKNLYLFDQALRNPNGIKREYYKIVSNNLNSLPEVFEFRKRAGEIIQNLITPRTATPRARPGM